MAPTLSSLKQATDGNKHLHSAKHYICCPHMTLISVGKHLVQHALEKPIMFKLNACVVLVHQGFFGHPEDATKSFWRTAKSAMTPHCKQCTRTSHHTCASLSAHAEQYTGGAPQTHATLTAHAEPWRDPDENRCSRISHTAAVQHSERGDRTKNEKRCLWPRGRYADRSCS